MAMSEQTTGFEDGQWCLLELMGHRKLAGFVREVSVGGAAMLRIDVPSGCTAGVSARWCARCGDCSCPTDQSDPAGRKDNLTWPLHGEKSDHAERTIATQFYGGASVYCITPVTEAIAKKLAASFRTEPVTAYDLPRRRQLAASAVGGDVDFDDIDEVP